MPESMTSRRAAVSVRAYSQLFDLQVVYSLTSDDNEASKVEHGEVAAAGSRRQVEASVAHLIIAKALIDVRHDWQHPGPLGPEPVTWLAPGPRDGAFALREFDAPAAIPCSFWIRCSRDSEVRFAREDAAEAGWGPDQLKHFAGWAAIVHPRWRGDLGTAFPDVEKLADNVATERADRYLGPDRLEHLEHRSLRDKPALPFVVGFAPGEFVCHITLNPDALDHLVLTLPPEQFVALQRLVEAGRARVGWWSGKLLVAPGDFEVVAVGDPAFGGIATEDDTSLRRRRLDYALACLYREARLTWQPQLPPVRNWRHSAVHRALRNCLPSLARQSLREQWITDRRGEVFESVLHLMLDGRVGLQMLERLKLADEKRLSAEATELVAQDHDPTHGWALYELGAGAFDPLSFNAIDRMMGDVTRSELEELAERYEAIPGLWSPELARALLHGLLLAETGEYLHDQYLVPATPFRREYLGPAIPLRTPHNAFRELPVIVALKAMVATARRRKAWGLFTSRLLDVALFSVLGAWVDGWRGAVIGLIVGGVVSGLHEDWARRQEANSSTDQLQRAMRLAVIDAAQSSVNWCLVVRRMREAALHGAVWAPEAWRLALSVSRRSAASRTDW